MIVIVEGPDGSGKSTLVEQLAESGSDVSVKHWGPVEDPMEAYARELSQHAAYRDTVVYDRFWPSETVYGNALRAGCRLGPSRIHALEALAASVHRTVMVLCDPGIDEVRKNVGVRKEGEDMEGVRDRISRIHTRYTTYRTRLPFVRYDYTEHDPPSIESLSRVAKRGLMFGVHPPTPLEEAEYKTVT